MPKTKFINLLYLLLVSLMVLPLSRVNADILYIGDAGGSDVKKFNAETNEYLGSLKGADCYGPKGPFEGPADGYWEPLTSGPCQPFGMFIRGKSLFVTNGNNGVYLDNTLLRNVSGDLMRFLVSNDKQQQKLVSPEDSSGNLNFDAPYSPEGALFYQGKVYVADMAELDPDDPTEDCGGYNGGGCKPGSIKIYNPGNGKLIDEMVPDKKWFDPKLFHPRGMVIKDGLLYVAVRKLPPNDDFQVGGWIVRFDLATGEFKDVFIASDGSCHPGSAVPCLDPVNKLNRPVGIVFGPDDNLYVVSFRFNANDTDKIIIFNGVTGAFVNKIDFAAPESTGAPRNYGEALLFGPEGRLIVPMTIGTLAGQVRSYDVTDPAFPYDVIVPANATGGAVVSGWFLTYGKTDPATLEYKK